MDLSHASHTSRYVTFKLADNLVGINILNIREIVPYIKITQVPQAPDYVLGLINLRGQILMVFDIGVLLGLPKRKIGKESHIIIFKHQDVGFIVDRIGDVISTEKEATEEIPANIEPEIQAYMENIVDLPDQILMILNSRKILARTLSGQSSAQGDL